MNFIRENRVFHVSIFSEFVKFARFFGAVENVQPFRNLTRVCESSILLEGTWSPVTISRFSKTAIAPVQAEFGIEHFAHWSAIVKISNSFCREFMSQNETFSKLRNLSLDLPIAKKFHGQATRRKSGLITEVSWEHLESDKMELSCSHPRIVMAFMIVYFRIEPWCLHPVGDTLYLLVCFLYCINNSVVHSILCYVKMLLPQQVGNNFPPSIVT